MYRLSSQSRRVTAATLLVVFLNVFFGQAVCALAMPAAAHGHGHQAGNTEAHHHEAEAPKGSRDHAAHGPHPHSHEKPGPHSHKSRSNGACCQDDAAAVWASLTHPPKVGIDKMVPLVFTMPAPFALVARAHHWNRTRPVLLVARRQLKPKIPDIRIFIQSLTV
jgi:hypothetical protein